MAQRLKAIEKAVADRSWEMARWLELIPTGDALLAPRSEALAPVREGEAEDKGRKRGQRPGQAELQRPATIEDQ